MLFSQIQNGRVILYINRPFVEEGHPAAGGKSKNALTESNVNSPQRLNVEKNIVSQQPSNTGSDDSIGYK